MKISHPTNKANFSCVETDNGTTVYFSYETPIGFHHYIGGAWTRVNNWRQTTGKHIGYVEREYGLTRAARLAGDIFEKQLANAQAQKEV